MQHVSVFGLPQRGAREGKDSYGPPFGRQELDLLRVCVPVCVYNRPDIAFATAEGALDRYRELRGGTPDTRALLDAIEDQGFEWGVSDGN